MPSTAPAPPLSQADKTESEIELALALELSKHVPQILVAKLQRKGPTHELAERVKTRFLAQNTHAYLARQALPTMPVKVLDLPLQVMPPSGQELFCLGEEMVVPSVADSPTRTWKLTLENIQELSTKGHFTVSYTVNLYEHRLEEVKRRVKEQVGQRFSPKLDAALEQLFQHAHLDGDQGQVLAKYLLRARMDVERAATAIADLLCQLG